MFQKNEKNHTLCVSLSKNAILFWKVLTSQLWYKPKWFLEECGNYLHYDQEKRLTTYVFIFSVYLQKWIIVADCCIMSYSVPSLTDSPGLSQ